MSLRAFCSGGEQSPCCVGGASEEQNALVESLFTGNMPIHFGTDGWRAVISDSFTFDNLRIVTQAIADAVASDYWDKSASGGNAPDKKKIVVGYDTRFLSDRFAGEVARVLAANGFSVLLVQSDLLRRDPLP
jgi:phosphomannomutase